VGQSLNTGFEAALSFVLGFITFIIAILPFMVLVVLPIYLVIRYLWRRYKKRSLANRLAREEKTE
jgi:type II secretory pathway component PulF